MIEQLHTLNQDISTLLVNLKQVPAEHESTDELVLTLQELVNKRQLLLNVLLQDETTLDAEFLSQQLELTKQFGSLASEIMAERQALLAIGNKNKRQINVYQTIDANR